MEAAQTFARSSRPGINYPRQRPEGTSGIGDGGIAMGRHNWSYFTAQQEYSTASSIAAHASSCAGRVGILAAALAICAAAASGTAVASPDTLSSNSADENTQQTSLQ